ncbi:MAG: rhomboid family intramembrane serine protease [Cyclobacteriaceae bacterium]|jgi:membrane associated rhomboid family serine protease|nr:rhomboid family intramembrane serine protease [Cyclobacteriaceae bacterium]
MKHPSLFSSSIVPLRIVFLMWLLFSLEAYYGWPLTAFGIVPRTLPGMVGIVMSPLLHGNIFHLLSNTVPLLFLGSVLYFFYPRLAPTVFFRAYFWTNLLVWLFARPRSIHIGASGIVYALAFFLIFFGIFYRDFRSLTITVIVFILYGGVFYGILPGDPHVSWESHFAGALVGIGSALTLSRKV